MALDISSARTGSLRCAIYTRKSSEEGLEQDFNSLDAQREACADYIRSQRSEGWRALPAFYDDGGYSGGTMERPALARLLADIKADRIDVVVVYKIDRLTRSLPDFARMVETFDAHKVSFVSVTQTFNTTTSMGRLTLNVLLSFAQFEREVTGERIRDKIAASKARGMWMGGTLPLGYDKPADTTRKLVVNEAEAQTVRRIFANYLDLGSVHALERHLAELGIRSKVHALKSGVIRGGVPFSRGALFHLLRNRLYLGEITHKEKHHPGLHPPIIDKATFEAVQEQLTSQARRTGEAEHHAAPSPLAGKLFDAEGHPMSPAFAYGRGGKLYRYYVSAFLQQGQKRITGDRHPRRIAASAIEGFVGERLAAISNNAGNAPAEQGKMLDAVVRLELQSGYIVATAQRDLLPGMQAQASTGDLRIEVVANEQVRIHWPYEVARRGTRTTILGKDQALKRQDPHLIRALRTAHAMLSGIGANLTINTAPQTRYRRKLLCLAFLAPDIQTQILDGQQPPALTLAKILNSKMPLSWQAQRAWILSLR